jgi:hypothetical protein
MVYSWHKGIIEVDFITSEVEEEEGDEDREEEQEWEDIVGPSPFIAEEDHIEQLMDVPVQ